jgi:hypothetical protein
MAPKGSRKGKGKATARAKMPTSVINRRLSLDRDCIKGFISEHIRGLIRIYEVCGVKDERAWDLFYDIIFLDPVTTRHFSPLQLMWPHCTSRSSPFWEWWAAFRSYSMGQMFDKTRDQRNNWRWDNPCAFGDQVDRSNLQPTSSGKVKRTGESFSWYGSISEKYFRPGGMASSEWTCSVRAVRDTAVADYSAPGLNTTRSVAYRPPIDVSPFLLALSVSYFNRTLWRCGQL